MHPQSETSTSFGFLSKSEQTLGRVAPCKTKRVSLFVSPKFFSAFISRDVLFNVNQSLFQTRFMPTHIRPFFLSETEKETPFFSLFLTECLFRPFIISPPHSPLSHIDIMTTPNASPNRSGAQKKVLDADTYTNTQKCLLHISFLC